MEIQMPSKKEILSKTKLEFYKEIKKFQSTLKPTKEIDGFGSSALVGEQNYPSPKIYNISTSKKENSFLNTNEIVKKSYSDIIKLKAQNILGNTNNIYIKKTKTKIIEEMQDIYKARKPVEFSSQFEKELKFNKPILNKLSGVLGTKNELLNIDLNQNAQTSKQIEKYTQNDIKAKKAIINLYEKGVPEPQIINLLGLGNFGIRVNRKIVPTRWTISAYDKAIENHICDIIKEYKIIEDYEIFYHSDKGNSFLVILIPDTYTAESIEYTPKGWSAFDYVSYTNKLTIPEPNTAGGFFATKLAILEYLRQKKRQAQIICIRQIDNYEIPLGVVFVRESVRFAMKNQIFKSNSLNDIKDYIKQKYTQFYSYFEKSKTLKEQKIQRKLRDFF